MRETENQTNPNADQDKKNDAEKENNEIPVPPDAQPNAPVEEPPETEKPPIGDKNNEPKRIVG
jgi:hypothetical protein